ncbi:alpha-1,2-fucosyltransferase [Candidatus Brocadia sapporoensis]|nr:alpha-1,2-fucosyltransferase [Candidatus Brocadia sapporoensis]MDG5996471.1 alpha-1,2-fucosyltransferase [Candidatus Brocadia sp.]MDG6006618.1 alpha-1,2-fucosyltransferase [Candidatus Brocadia sp.]
MQLKRWPQLKPTDAAVFGSGKQTIMIIVKLMGGLGNQMFQYAAGRRLAEKLGVKLKLDIEMFKDNTLRKYELGAFNIQECFAAVEEIERLTVVKRGIVEKALDRVFKRPIRRPGGYVAEKYFVFDPSILQLPDQVYLDGYWQSEKYFAEIETIIREEFTIKYPQTDKNKVLSDSIKSGNSVTVHVRRGDYVNNPETNSLHGVCGIDYYQRCIDFIITKIANPHFFFFSDDPEWVKNNLKIKYESTVVEHNGAEKCYEDLRLLSQGKYHIIANSTFSWWGAWLNKNPEKMVVAPEKWFKKEDVNTKGFIPEDWIRL